MNCLGQVSRLRLARRNRAATSLDTLRQHDGHDPQHGHPGHAMPEAPATQQVQEPLGPVTREDTCVDNRLAQGPPEVVHGSSVRLDRDGTLVYVNAKENPDVEPDA